MKVTIISDASVCMQTFVGGYGFWAVSPRGSHAGEGMFKSKLPPCADIAEAMAIVNSLHCALSMGIAEAGDQILVQTDCLNAIQFFEKGARRKAKQEQIAPILKRYSSLLSAQRLQVEFRHVRGHTRVMDQRSKAQRLTDKRAKNGMKKARTALGKPVSQEQK